MTTRLINNIYKIFVPLLILAAILAASNPKDKDYAAYLGRLAKISSGESTQYSRSGEENIEYLFKSSYCKSYDTKIQRQQCENIVKLAKEANPNYLEDWLNSKGSKSFIRKDYILFSFYDFDWSTELSGDERGSPRSSGTRLHLGVLGNFIDGYLAINCFVLIPSISTILILIAILFLQKKK